MSESRHCTTCARMDSGFNCLHHCKGPELSAYLPFSEAKKCVSYEIPYLATNGDMLKAIFADAVIEIDTTSSNDISVVKNTKTNEIIITANKNWLDTPYDFKACKNSYNLV